MADHEPHAESTANPAPASKPERINHQRFYSDLAEAERLQLSRHEVDWLQRHTKPDRSAEVLLAFGCGVQTVPHRMLTQLAVLKVLGVDFVATAGQPHRTTSATASGPSTAARTYRSCI